MFCVRGRGSVGDVIEAIYGDSTEKSSFSPILTCKLNKDFSCYSTKNCASSSTARDKHLFIVMPSGRASNQNDIKRSENEIDKFNLRIMFVDTECWVHRGGWRERRHERRELCKIIDKYLFCI